MVLENKDFQRIKKSSSHSKKGTHYPCKDVYGGNIVPREFCQSDKMEGLMLENQANFYLLKNNHGFLPEGRRNRKKKVLACEHVDVIHAFIQQKLIGCLLCARSCVGVLEV